MTTTTEETSVPQVGDILNGHGNAMPIGTVIRGNVSDRVWEKRPDGWHYIEGGSGAPDGPLVQPSRRGNYTIVRVGPAASATTPILSMEQLLNLPIGTVVGRPANHTRWTKQENGRWRSVAGTVREDTYFALNGSYHVISTPEFEPVEETSSESEHPFPVGYALMSIEEIDRLPVGTVIGPGDYETYTKVHEGAVGDGAWEHNGDTQDFFAEHGHNQVLSYPTTEETPPAGPNSITVEGRTFTVGQEVERTSDFRLLPIGTELLENNRTPHRKTGDREFMNTRDGGTIGITNFYAYQHHVITALPDQQTSPYQVGLIIDTRELMTGLPAGTVLKVAEGHQHPSNRDNRWVVQDDGTYRNQRTGVTGRLQTCRADSYMQIESLPSASGSDSEPSGPFPLGHRLASVEEVSSLPPGTGIGHRVGETRFFMRGDGQVGTVGHEHHPGYIHQPTSFTGGFCVTSYPEPPSYTVGQRMDDAAWQAVPIGSVVHFNTDPQYAYRKDGPSAWTGVGAYSSGTHWYRDLGTCTLTWVPGEYPRRRQTLGEYQQMFRTIVYGAQQANSVDAGPVDAAMDALGIPQPTVAIGLVVDACDQDLLYRLPEGTVLKGGDPKHHASFGVFVKQGGTWTHILGGHTRFDGVLTVVTIPGHAGRAPWVATSGTDQDQSGIEEFKTRAADLGTKAKRSNSWCGAYEGAMHRAGIDQPITD